ncbi:MAG: hypothetical protein GEU99_10940 [Luteitalea sp.]|nr:hypothetical protein [Luteitalea sp.]
MWKLRSVGSRQARDKTAESDPTSFEHALTILSTPAHVLAAFFDPRALAEWWGVRQAVTVPRPLGVYAVDWAPTDVRDELLGPLGGAFYGTIIDYRADREFFVADAYWLPPEGDPIGPMALDVTCEASGSFAWLHVRQSGCDDSPRWRRYYRIIDEGWTESLLSLKAFLED